MDIILTDDGTLDTVLRCSDCGEEFRFSYEPTEEDEGNEAAYDTFVDECIAEIEDEHECPADAPSGPQEGDITTEDHRRFYQYGKLILTVEEDEDYKEVLREHMNQEQFWSNIWFISDHGNAHLIDLSGK